MRDIEEIKKHRIIVLKQNSSIRRKMLYALKISAHDLDPFLSIEDGHIAVHDERNEGNILPSCG